MTPVTFTILSLSILTAWFIGSLSPNKAFSVVSVRTMEKGSRKAVAGSPFTKGKRNICQNPQAAAPPFRYNFLSPTIRSLASLAIEFVSATRRMPGISVRSTSASGRDVEFCVDVGVRCQPDDVYRSVSFIPEQVATSYEEMIFDHGGVCVSARVTNKMPVCKRLVPN